MSSTDIPTGFVPRHPLTSTPTTSDTTLVDDPVALVDDATALVGGPTTPLTELKGKVGPSAVPRPIITTSR